jgi:hypothetical protein
MPFSKKLKLLLKTVQEILIALTARITHLHLAEIEFKIMADAVEIYNENVEVLSPLPNKHLHQETADPRSN